MFLDFLLFEIKLRLKSVATYCYFGLWFVVAFSSVAATDFGPVGAGKVLLNGPFATQRMDVILTFFGSIVIAAIFGTSILRDFQRDTYQIVFTKPITKFAYLGGRWAGSLITTLLVFTGLPIGEAIGSFAPWADHTRIAPIDVGMLAYHYAVLIAPQIFFLGSIFFLVAALTRQVIVVYLQGAALFAIYFIDLVAVSQARSLRPFWPAVFDPVGMLLSNSVTRYWTVADQNTLWMPLTGMFMWNRIVWGSVGVLALIAVFVFFPMSAEALTARRSRKQKKVEQESTAPPAPRFHHLIPSVSTSFSIGTLVQQLVSLSRIYLKNIFREIPFWAISLIMIIFCLVNGHEAGHLGGTNVWPVTYLMLQAVEGNGILFLYIVATMYAGELIWRERDTRFEQIHDALPVPSWLDTLGKLIALASAEAVLLFVVMLCGIVSQATTGHFHF
jgi:ABC-type transport system involved in multi-copper enzyme maturation permease subunit